MKYNLLNRKFGKWLVLREDKSAPPSRTRWFCRCDCGKEKSVMTQNLIKGGSLGCGRGYCCPSFSHGMRNTPEYHTWVNLKQRCLNKKAINFRHYGGRGIKIFEPWINDFNSFIGCVGLRPTANHSLDRINVNGNYEPGNVRWTFQDVQSNNKRTSKIISFRGESMSASQWANKIGVHRNLILRRLKSGWSVEKTISTPSNRHPRYLPCGE